MKNIAERFKNNLAATRESEQGDIVQTLLIIAAFVLIVVVVGNLLYNTVTDKADDVSDCIAQSGAGAGTSQGSSC